MHIGAVKVIYGMVKKKNRYWAHCYCCENKIIKDKNWKQMYAELTLRVKNNVLSSKFKRTLSKHCDKNKL